MEVEIINILLPLRILILNKFHSIRLYLAKRKKRKSEKISRASGNCAHEMSNCAQSKSCRKWM